MCVSVYAWMKYVCEHCASTHMWMYVHNFVELLLSFYLYGGYQIFDSGLQVCAKHLHPLNQFTYPLSF